MNCPVLSIDTSQTEKAIQQKMAQIIREKRKAKEKVLERIPVTGADMDERLFVHCISILFGLGVSAFIVVATGGSAAWVLAGAAAGSGLIKAKDGIARMRAALIDRAIRKFEANPLPEALATLSQEAPAAAPTLQDLTTALKERFERAKVLPQPASGRPPQAAAAARNQPSRG